MRTLTPGNEARRGTAALLHSLLLGSVIVAATPFAKADTPAPGAQTQAELTTANTIAVARYGAAVTPPEGKVENFDKLLPLVLALQPAAYDKLAQLIASRVGDVAPGTVLITTRSNTAALLLSAQQVEQEVQRLVDEGDRLGQAAPEMTFGGPLTIPAVMSIAGGIDSLVGLFRTNYNVAGGKAEPNKLGLQLAVYRALSASGVAEKITKRMAVIPPPSSKSPVALIDELALASTGNAEFNALLIKLAKLRHTVALSKPADNSPGARFVVAADAVLSALRNAGTDGVTPAARVSLLLEIAKHYGSVLYLDIVEPSATAVTTKRLFSRNAKVHLTLTALVNIALQDKTGNVLASTTLKVGERATLNLRELEASSYPALDIGTSSSWPRDRQQEQTTCPCESAKE